LVTKVIINQAVGVITAVAGGDTTTAKTGSLTITAPSPAAGN